MARRTLTAEQQARTDARRERFADLARQLAAMDDDARAELAAQMDTTRTIEGRELSPGNAALMALQNPDATLVGGFQQWRRAGRTVRKGEHGLMIWAPTARLTERQETPATAGADEKHGPSFITITVFDVAQTDALGGGQ